METIKDFWYAVIVDGRPVAAHKEKNNADAETYLHENATVERVRITIDRIKE